MGYLIKGEWHEGWYDTGKTAGEFIRAESQFRNRVTADGASGYPAEAERYHLYVSLACPWAHRTLIFRALKGLEAMVGVSIVHWFMGAEGWRFADGEAVVPDTANGKQKLFELYAKMIATQGGKIAKGKAMNKAKAVS